jgi:hypothetical protein
MSMDRVMEHLMRQNVKAKPRKKFPKPPEDETPLGQMNQRLNATFDKLNQQQEAIKSYQSMNPDAADLNAAVEEYNDLRKMGILTRQDMVIMRESYGFRGGNEELVNSAWPLPPRILLSE